MRNSTIDDQKLIWAKVIYRVASPPQKRSLEREVEVRRERSNYKVSIKYCDFSETLSDLLGDRSTLWRSCVQTLSLNFKIFEKKEY